MSRWRRALSLVLAAGSLLGAAEALSGGERAMTQRFGFGKPATPAQIAGWDIDVRPDGKGLPPGRGSVAQGQKIYDDQCASCHGTFGEGTEYMAIAGGVGTLRSDQPIRTTGSKLNFATTLFDYIRRAMPFPNPKSLKDDEVYAVTAYVLHLNDILPADAVLDRESLPRVRMPNRDGFTTAHGMMTKDGKPDTHNVACMRDCSRAVRVTSEIPEHAHDSHGALGEQSRALGPVQGMAAAANSPQVPLAAATPGAMAGMQVARTAGCMACHGITDGVVGPAFRAIAARYAGDADAAQKLEAKVRSGGAGVWGSTPMPAQTLSAEQAKTVVAWVLRGAP